MIKVLSFNLLHSTPYAPQLAKYARPAAQKGCASYAQGLAPPFCPFIQQTFQPTFSIDTNFGNDAIFSW